MHGLKGERVLLRIFIGESDHWQGKPLYQQIVALFASRHYAGATVIRGILGFGASARLHSTRFPDAAFDLPIIIECVETEERIDAILPELEAMLGGGLITLERAHVIMYRAAPTPEEHPAG